MNRERCGEGKCCHCVDVWLTSVRHLECCNCGHRIRNDQPKKTGVMSKVAENKARKSYMEGSA